MFRFYMEFIFNNIEKYNQKSNNIKNIIYINNEMLYKLKNKTYLLYGGVSDSATKKNKYESDLQDLTKSTINIIKSLEDPFNKQKKQMHDMYNALQQMIKYIDLLYDNTTKEDLGILRNQLSDLKNKFGEYINIE